MLHYCIYTCPSLGRMIMQTDTLYIKQMYINIIAHFVYCSYYMISHYTAFHILVTWNINCAAKPSALNIYEDRHKCMVNTIFNCWQTLNMFPVSLQSWKYSYNLWGTVASETEWAGMTVFYQYCIKMLPHFQYSSYSSLTWYISITPCDKVRRTQFLHFSCNVFNAYMM